jgi:23S rRNA-/tRNA-specific pseudouridylate synthase
MQGFKTRQIKKTYLALVNGNLPRTDGQIKIPLQEGCALTEYKVISRRKDFDLVEVRPVTGRTNQIRLHFKALGHPVLGDDRFAFRRDFRLKAKRLMLYAKELEFMHPVTGRPIHLRLDLNKELREFLTSHS